MIREDAPGKALRRALVARLTAWFAREKRDLPWRRTGDPYAIWISEAMLQQTRVEVVVPYFERFLERFPDVQRLADAPEDALLAAWSGLGYYRRARFLREAARVIVARHAGRFPEVPEAARALPGVGPYTAGAVLSIAYGQSEPLVDGNVARVFARLFALESAQGSPALLERCWALARALVPRADAPVGSRPGEWNQALMELGARVCVPRAPRCAGCPLETLCAARRAERELELPHPRARPATREVELEVLLVVRAGRVLVLRRAAEGRMASLWELPTRECPTSVRAGTLLWPAQHSLSSLARRGRRELGSVTHSITRHRIRARVFVGAYACRARANASFIEANELASLGATGMTRKILASGFVRQALEGRRSVP